MYTLTSVARSVEAAVGAFARSQSVPEEKLWSAGETKLVFSVTSCPFEESLIVEVIQIQKKPDNL